MKNRITALLLALLMVIGMIPAPVFATDSSGATEETTQTICSVCNLTDCTVTHIQCEKCGNYDCTTDHTNWCDICKLDSCGVDHSAVTEPTDATDSTCVTCGAVNCTADHTNWCADCKKDDCGVDHSAVTEPTDATDSTCVTCGTANCTADHTNWCDTCKKDNCGVDHGAAIDVAVCEICGNDPCTCEPTVDNCAYCEETTAEDGTVTHEATCNTNYEVDASADIGKTAAFSMVYSPALYSAEKPTSGFDYDLYDGDDSYDLLEAEYNYDDPPLVEITDWFWDVSGAALWYRVKPLEGETLPEGITMESWIFQYHTNEDTTTTLLPTLVITSLDILGKTVAFNEGSANLYDGIEGNVLAADAVILNTMVVKDLYTDGASTWYYVDTAEGEIWPDDYADYHHVAATDVTVVEKPVTPEIVDGKEVEDEAGTVAIKGSLPADATVEIKNVTDSAIMSELGIKGGFVADISILSSGAVWQPDGTVTITLKVDGDYPIITHYLDDVDAITAGIADGSAMVMDVSGKSAATKALLAPAIAGYQTATNTTEEKVAVEWINDVQDNGDGTINFETDSLSVYTANESGYFTELDKEWYQTNVNLSMTQQQWDSVVGDKVTFLGHYRVTPGTSITLTDGDVTSSVWALYVNDAHIGIANSYQTSKQTISNDYAELSVSRLSYDSTLEVTSSAPAGTVVQVNMVSADGWTYYVKFIVVENVITVTFNPNGGSVSPSSVQTAAGMAIALPTPTRDGYMFGGWSDGTTTYNGTYTAPNSSVELIAQWTKAVNITFVGNGGTVNGSETYVMPVAPGIATVLPHADTWTDSNGVTYYFDGWYTAAAGGSPVGEINVNKSAAQGNTATDLIFEYAVTGNTIVYAHWTQYEELANSKNFIMIGLINNYYIPLADGGGYPISGTDHESYHQFPNEPAGIGHEQTYRVDDRTGGWTLKLHGKETYPLVGSPFDYIDPSILSASAYFKSSPIAGDNTKGVFDADGSDVYQFLKLSESDKKQIIQRWLEVIISETDDYSPSVAAKVKADLETSFGVDFTGKTAADLVDDFQLIPYVVKHHPDRVGEIGWWVIDMIIVPISQVTLGYDLNIPVGYSLSAGTAPSSSTYTLTDPATVANVVNKPSVTVSKTLNGTTVYATFSHWMDEAGNTYGGNTGNGTIVMDTDKMLRAVWMVNESIPGTLTVTKDVNADGDIQPSGTEEFNFTFSIVTSNCAANDPYIKTDYNYTIYNGGMIVKTGTIGNNGTFILQDGWSIYIENLPDKARITVTEPKDLLPQYFIPAKTVETRDISAGQNTSLTFTNAYPRVYYTVEHYLQKDDGTYTLEDSEQLVGTVGEQTEAIVKTYTDYILSESANQFNTDGSLKQETISADGTTVVKIYYDLIPSTGNLTISKTVIASSSWSSDAFAFTVAGTGLKPGIYTVTVGSAQQQITVGDDGELSMSVSIAVSAVNTKTSLTILGLPVGSYTATETAKTSYIADETTISVSVTKNATAEAAFTNEYKPAKLIVSKRVDGSDTTQKFSIKVTFSDGNSQTVELANGESKTFENIPLGNYKVEELDIPLGFYETIKGATGTAEAGVIKEATVINKYEPAGLTITKNVEEVETGTNTPEVTKFRFTIAFPTGLSLEDSYEYTVSGVADAKTATVSGGEMVIELEKGQTATFANLPTGSYTVTETDYSAQGYDSNYKVNNAADYTAGNIAGVTVTKNATQTVVFKNKFPVGDLIIEKAVTKEFYGTEWNGDTFTFTLERTTTGRPLVANNQYKVLIDGVEQDATIAVDNNGKLTVEITFDGTDAAKLDEETEANASASHTLTIKNLPAGTYKVTEAANTAYSQTPTDLTISVTIPAENVKVSFENTLKRKTGGLTLEKELVVLEGYQPPADVTKFSFTIELLEAVPEEDKTFTVSYDPNQYTDNTAAATSVTMSEGKFTVTLEANQKVTISGLPEGEYRVTEATVPYYANAFAHKENGSWVVQSITTTDDGQMYTEIDIPATGTAEVKCTNTYPVNRAELIIQKLVTKKYERDTLPDIGFTFTVTLAEEDKDSYSYTIYNSDGTKDTTSSGTAPVTNNVFTVILEAGQYVVFPDMPVCGYTVSENVDTTDYNASYKVYVSETGESASTQVNTTGTVNTSGTGISVSRTFSAGKTDSIVFTNEYKRHLGTLTITKTVNGGSAEDTFIFHIKGNDTNNSYIDMDVTITGSNSITIYDLPLGNYTVTEDTDWSWRYQAASASASANLTIDSLDAIVEFTNTYTENRWLNYFANMSNVFGKKENE